MDYDSFFRQAVNQISLPQACNFIKKETLAQVFSCEFFEISKNNIFTEHLWTTASVMGEVARNGNTLETKPFVWYSRYLFPEKNSILDV